MTVPALAADTPATEDQLGFTPHAQSLAATILKDLPKDQSFVIGIEGEWGEGKSSFIHFLKQAFPQGETDPLRPTLVEFNPWWFEGSDQLLRHFFDELLGQIDWTRKEGAAIRSAISGLAGFLQKAGKAAQAIPEPSLQLGGKVAEGIGGLLSAAPATQSFSRLRSVAKETLAALQFKTIVFIDDLDRLPASEICELFRVIKAVADLPNIVYVIAYDRAIVASALDEVHKGRGEAYLEKIIQLPFRLPKPTPAQFLAYNTKLLAGFWIDGAPALPDNGEEHAALALIVKAFLPRSRDAKRLLAALLVNLALPDEIRMDRLDFIFLEAMRLKDQAWWRATLRAWLDCGRYAAMKQSDWDAVMQGEEEVTSSDRREWVESHFGSLTIKKPALLAAMRCFTGLPFYHEPDSMPRHQPVRGLSQFGVAKRADDLKELAVAYLQGVLPESALSKKEINDFVLADTAEQVANAINSCAFPPRLLQAAGDFSRTEFVQQRLTLSQLKAHFTAVAVYIDKHLDLTLLDDNNKYVRPAWILSDWFGTVVRYIQDGLFLVEPEQNQNQKLVGRAEALLLSWLDPLIAPRTVAELVFLSGDRVYSGLKAKVIGYFVARSLAEFLKSGAAGGMLEFMARSEGDMPVYRRIWLEKLPSPTVISDQEKELLGRMVTNWNPEIFQNWLFEAKPFTALVETVRDSGFNEEITEGCQQFLAQAEQLLVASRP